MLTLAISPCPNDTFVFHQLAVSGEFDLGFDDGPRADKAHFTSKNVPQLRQLVEARLANEAANPGDPWILLQFVIGFPLGPHDGVLGEQILQHLVGVGDHAAELPRAEAATVTADPLL